MEAWPTMDYGVLEVLVIEPRPPSEFSNASAETGEFMLHGHEFVPGLLEELEAPGALSIALRIRRAVREAQTTTFSVKANEEAVCRLSLPDDFWRNLPALPTVLEAAAP